MRTLRLQIHAAARTDNGVSTRMAACARVHVRAFVRVCVCVCV
jgi:tRNA U38,U39,U40 pseudouridine synthase TruA